MVCLPCIFLPIMMAIYIKFIMPYLYRILPQSWVTFLDPYLYPTCPIEIPEGKKSEEASSEKTEACCTATGEETKKDQ